MLENTKKNISQIKCFGLRCKTIFWAFSNTLSTFYFKQVISKQIPRPQIICLVWMFIIYFKSMRETQVTQCFSFQFCFMYRSEYQGNVGCVLDTVLTREDTISSAAAETPDTAFYQWVPFTLLFQVSWRL